MARLSFECTISDAEVKVLGCSKRCGERGDVGATMDGECMKREDTMWV
jgi:hypothetical protein